MKALSLILFTLISVYGITQIPELSNYQETKPDSYIEAGKPVRYINQKGVTMFVFSEACDDYGVLSVLNEADRVLEPYDIYHNLSLNDFLDDDIDVFVNEYMLDDGGVAFIKMRQVPGKPYKSVHFGVKYKELP